MALSANVFLQPPDGTVDPKSASVVARMAGYARGDGVSYPWPTGKTAQKPGPFGAEGCAGHIYTATSATPRTPVHLENDTGTMHTAPWQSRLDTALNSIADANGNYGVPFPPEAAPLTSCSDGPIYVYVTDTGEYYELFKARVDPATGTWWAQWGGMQLNYADTTGFFNPDSYPPYSSNGWGTKASSGQFKPGAITSSEWYFGGIKHAIHVSVPDALKAPYFQYPAQRTDGTQDPTVVPDGIQYGDRFYLPSNFQVRQSVSDLNAQILAKAVKDYGMIPDDRAPAVAFPHTGGDTPLLKDNLLLPDGTHGTLSQTDRAALIQAFPWESLVLQARKS